MHEFLDELVSPPWIQLSEAVDWVILSRFGRWDDGPNHDRSMDELLDKLCREQLVGYGSLDASPIQQIEPCAWSEFDLFACTEDGRIRKRGEPVTGYVFLSGSFYRAAALKDLSRPAFGYEIAGPNLSTEQAYHRVISQVTFHEDDMRKAFPLGGTLSPLVVPKPSKYAKALRALEDGKYYSSPGELTFSEIARKLWPLFENKQLSHATVLTGITRHYRNPPPF